MSVRIRLTRRPRGSRFRRHVEGGSGKGRWAQPPKAQHTPHQASQFRIAGHSRHLILPEVDETLGKLVDIGGLGHAVGV